MATPTQAPRSTKGSQPASSDWDRYAPRTESDRTTTIAFYVLMGGILVALIVALAMTFLA